MAPRRTLVISIVVVLMATFSVVGNHLVAQAQAPPSIYTCVNLKGEALKKAVSEHPEILTQLNPEGRNLLSLIFSYQKPSAEDVQMLLKAGADPRSTDYYGHSVLHYAAVSGTPKIIQLLVKAGADVNQRDQQGRTPLRELARIPGSANKDNSEALVALGAHLDTFSAAALGKTSELQGLISADPDSLNEEDQNHYSPIDWAVLRHQKEVLAVIARSNPKVNIYRAAAIGDESTVTEALKKSPGSINAVDRHRLTALDWAVMAGDENMAKLLLERGADANFTHPLLIAARFGDVEIAKLLLQHGADPSNPATKLKPEEREAVENADPYGGVDPYQYAINFHHNDVAELIKNARKSADAAH